VFSAPLFGGDFVGVGPRRLGIIGETRIIIGLAAVDCDRFECVDALFFLLVLRRFLRRKENILLNIPVQYFFSRIFPEEN
jgi:hypothetical protein